MYELKHSAKGTYWSKKDHKYVKKEGTRYWYPTPKKKSEPESFAKRAVDYGKNESAPPMAGFAAKALKRGQEKKGTLGFAKESVDYVKKKTTQKIIKDSYEKVKNEVISVQKSKGSLTDKISGILKKIGKQKITVV